MKALLLKDFFLLQRMMRIVLILAVLYVVLFLLTGATDALPFVLVIFAVSFPVSTFSYDEADKWDRYTLSGPLHRRDIVRAKYVFALLLMAAALALSLLSMGAFSFFMPVRPLGEILIMLGLEICIGLLGISILLPFIYKLGAEKGRQLMVAVLMIPVFAIVLYSKFASAGLKQFTESHLMYFPFVLATMAVAGDYLSYRISLKIYLKKDF